LRAADLRSRDQRLGRFDLALALHEMRGNVLGLLKYRAELFGPTTISVMLAVRKIKESKTPSPVRWRSSRKCTGRLL